MLQDWTNSMGKFDFEDEPNEPTFSFGDFMKFLSKQGDGIKNESIVPEKIDPEKDKEAFKEKLRTRRKNKKKD
jgi:hypothetical protein